MIESRLKSRIAWIIALVVVIGQGCTSVGNMAPVDADGQIVRFLSTYLPRLAESQGFSGVVLFARDEEILFYEAFGLANRQGSIRNEPSTQFNLASASKMFTAVAIAKLQEEGRLSLEDPVGKYLGSDWISPEVGFKVLLRHLLCHTSGLGSYWDKWDQYSMQIHTIDDFRLVVSDTLAFEPGTRYEYSNSGFILLGAVIEKVTGETYYDYVQRTIFDLCGMAGTGFYRNDIVRQSAAIGYYEDRSDNRKLKDNLSLHGVIGASGGGGWSTASDLHRFFLAMRDNRIVSRNARDALWSPKPFSPNYGYGFQISGRWIGHTGGFPGIDTFAYYFPTSGHTFIVLSNFTGSALPLMKKMNRRFGLLRAESPAPSVSTAL
jgi:CubicO group peptidase (beta-lactamase class C family)